VLKGEFVISVNVLVKFGLVVLLVSEVEECVVSDTEELAVEEEVGGIDVGELDDLEADEDAEEEEAEEMVELLSDDDSETD
jgi:hypothetical protein